MTSTRYVFTINNPEAPLDTAAWEAAGVRLAVWQQERGAEGTPHLQGYITFKKNHRRPAVERLLGGRAFLEPAKGKHAQCVAYCTKEDTRVGGPFYWPDRNAVEGYEGQGTRSDLAEAAALVREGRPLSEVDDVTLVRNYRGLKFLAEVHNPARIRDHVYVLCIHGPPGIGKTTACYERMGSQPYTPKITETGTIWFDGYAGEEILLLDDFRGQIPIHEFNAICDRFPYRAPVKGGFVAARWELVIILTNVDPRDWYAKFGQRQDEVSAVYRRIGYGEEWAGDPAHRYEYCGTRETLLELFGGYAAIARAEADEEEAAIAAAVAAAPAMDEDA